MDAKTPSRRGLAAAALTAALVSPLLMSASAEAKSVGDYSVTGHRGFPSANVTENTIASFNRALDNGASAVEFDIRPTADRGYIVMHDATLRRTTTCNGKVGSLTLSEIQDECLGSLGDEKIPSLGDALTWAQDRRINLIVEIKHQKGTRWVAEDFVAVDALVHEHRLADRVIYHGLHDEDLETLKAAVPSAQVEAIAFSWRQAVRQSAWADGVNLYAADLNAKRVKRLHAQGLLVLGRMTNSKADWERLNRVGVDGLLTDDTGGYATWRRERG